VTALPVHQASGRERAVAPTIAVVGNPNTGKSTLFNALTGLRQKVGNYPGVTVEKHVGTVTLDAGPVELVDLPGTYSLAAHSPDELIAVDVLCGLVPGVARPRAVLVVADATNLRRNLFLAHQVREMGLPVVIALNMSDLCRSRDIDIDAQALERELGVPVIPTVATSGEGLEVLRRRLQESLETSPQEPSPALPELRDAVRDLRDRLETIGVGIGVHELERAVIDVGGAAEARLVAATGPEVAAHLDRIRHTLSSDVPLPALEARARYAAIDGLLARIERRGARVSVADRVDRAVNHPVIGSLLFIAVMGAVFQAVFAWAAPAMGAIDWVTSALGDLITRLLPAGAVASLLVDGVLGGVGAVLVFLPQIVILFAFIIVLEDTGYMARAAFMMDRLMRSCGLSGHSFIPMLSSFACAVPGIMATRVIRDRRDRLATILAAPFMTCSARLPVYALLIGAFVPSTTVLGVLNLQGLTLLALYVLGIVGGVGAAWLAKRTVLRGPAPPFLMELPPYRWPSWRSAAYRLFDRAKAFVVRAGTFIFVVSMVVWALAYFPRSETVAVEYEAARVEAASTLAGDALVQRLDRLEDLEAAANLEHSLLGRTGRFLEPLFRPLGWDWKLSAAVVASFPAREVVIAVLGTTYAVGSDADDTSLVGQLRAATHADGSPVFTVPVALGLMVFFAFCMQCVSTLAIMQRETNSWRWPVVAWAAMTALAWIAAWLTVHVAARWWG
jgi:ferrous iron transport protein B